MTNDTEVIKLLRFPLAILVVLIHSYSVVEGYHISQINYFDLAGRDYYSLFCISFSHVLAQVAVPLFFFISGYLFFLNFKQWSWAKWKEKLKRRTKTLLIPYITWITIAVLEKLFTYFAAYIIKGKPISRIGEWFQNVGGFGGIYWNDKSHMDLCTNIFGWESYMTYPLLIPMWFLRDLMVVVLLSPVIYFLLKKIPQISLLLIGCLWVLGAGTKLPGLSFSSLFMFGLGGVFSLYSKSFVVFFKPINRWFLIAVFSMLFVLSVVFDGRSTHIGQLCLHFWILFAIPLFIRISNYILENKKSYANKIAALADTSFFIYAFHGRHISYVFHLLWVLFGIKTIGSSISEGYIDAHPLVGIISYILTPIITVVLCIVIFKILKRILPPKIMMLLNGK